MYNKNDVIINQTNLAESGTCWLLQVSFSSFFQPRARRQWPEGAPLCYCKPRTFNAAEGKEIDKVDQLIPDHAKTLHSKTKHVFSPALVQGRCRTAWRLRQHCLVCSPTCSTDLYSRLFSGSSFDTNITWLQPSTGSSHWHLISHMLLHIVWIPRNSPS